MMIRNTMIALAAAVLSLAAAPSCVGAVAVVAGFGDDDASENRDRRRRLLLRGGGGGGETARSLSAAFVPAVVGEDPAATTGTTAHFMSDWVIPRDLMPYPSVTVRAGDTLTFSWEYGTHDVWIYPSGSCDPTGGIEIGSVDDNPTTYTFREEEAGTTITFACDIGSHCDAGMIMDVVVAPDPEEKVVVDEDADAVVEDGQIEDGQIEDGQIEDDEPEEQQQPGCPLDVPGYNQPCTDVGESCSYGHAYSGNTWGNLRCVPAVTCGCSDDSVSGPGFPRWSCRHRLVPHLAGRESVASIAGLDPAVAAAAATDGIPVISKPERQNMFPVGACDPDEPLPPPPPSSEDGDCPDLAPPSGVKMSCEGYPVGSECQYDHVYSGCSWDALRCSWTKLCTCSPDGIFVCAVAGMAACLNAPGDLPWGSSCDPEEEIFPDELDADVDVDGGNATDIVPVEEDDADIAESEMTEEEEEEDTTVVDGRLSNECPENPEFGSCAGYVPGLGCDYNHAYTGCTWETLKCTPIMDCECGGVLGDGNWSCRSMSMMPCEEKPDSLPTFRSCDPNDPLPVEPTRQDDDDAAVVATTTTTSERVRREPTRKDDETTAP